ncbi:transposase [Victivallis vadensis]|uniref:transposase n=1 Tax=Victivallis vadensis TaxID=172901 RepID=UPI003AF9E064
MANAHAPVHWLDGYCFMVTGATYLKKPLWDTPEKLTRLTQLLLRLAARYGWRPEAWAVLNNHYHVIVNGSEKSRSLREMICRLHGISARGLNELDGAAERRVWYQYWDSRITFEKSYFARLNYVHNNPAYHGVVPVAANYPWCSKNDFMQKADSALVRTVSSFRYDKLDVLDDF